MLTRADIENDAILFHLHQCALSAQGAVAVPEQVPRPARIPDRARLSTSADHFYHNQSRGLRPARDVIRDRDCMSEAGKLTEVKAAALGLHHAVDYDRYLREVRGSRDAVLKRKRIMDWAREVAEGRECPLAPGPVGRLSFDRDGDAGGEEGAEDGAGDGSGGGGGGVRGGVGVNGTAGETEDARGTDVDIGDVKDVAPDVVAHVKFKIDVKESPSIPAHVKRRGVGFWFGEVRRRA